MNSLLEIENNIGWITLGWITYIHAKSRLTL